MAEPGVIPSPTAAMRRRIRIGLWDGRTPPAWRGYTRQVTVGSGLNRLIELLGA